MINKQVICNKAKECTKEGMNCSHIKPHTERNACHIETPCLISDKKAKCIEIIDLPVKKSKG